ncbi:P-loop containing nucleoside triphosphate hydrolase protein [Pavlovales sp. CCMP2436]|nr:P-loop containing nucleoside triphosphate hydrolase protein [Pavlovales sp. CCMP2436]
MDAIDLKLVLLGNPGVGKTAIVCRYLYGSFGETTSTIGASFALKRIAATGGGTCNVGIWDTAGQERFDALSSFYCRGARAALVVYDSTDRASFDALPKWLKKVHSEAEPGCHVCLVASKADLVQGGGARVVSETEMAALVAKYDASYFETSAVDGSMINEAFACAVERYNERQAAQRAEQATTSIGVNLTRTPARKAAGGCC